MIRSVFWIFLSYCLGRSIAFSCVCNPAECETLTDDDCPDRAGTVWDPCGCCKVCARAENQPCGGPYGFFGSCAHDLECVVTDVTNENSGGVCTRVMNKSESCDKYHFVSGCNIIDHTCKCEEVSICNTENGTPQTTPFPTTHAPLDGSPDGGGIGADSRGIDNDRAPDNRGISDGASDTRVEEPFGEPPDKSPFSFVNRLECEMNLKVLLTHEILDDNTGKNLDSVFAPDF